ncbi:pyridoxamine 5'-phosphate oxidase family protein [Nocardioides panacisoli]|nr:pyridoxamine 5'-phosphate oxidase family protein [Nocardioides panacisoli]QYJ03525.1 pyridoxamine 5'-phosphate oxidase family protein [Nocardioides panacisoli]
MGSPQASIVWAERRGDELAMFFMATSTKMRNLRHNPRLAVVSVDDRHLHGPGVPAYALLTGSVDLRAGEPDMPDRLARAHGNPNGYPWKLGEFNTVVMTVDRVTGLGPVHGGTMGGWRRP